MAKKKAASKGESTKAEESKAAPDQDTTTSSAPDPQRQGDVEDEVELFQVDLGDMVKMKQVLDESVCAAVLEHVPENYSWDNVKLLIMFTACVFAMVAQFAPIPFPDSRPLLGLCGAAYFLLSGVLQYITTFIDKDAILLTKPCDPQDEKQVPRKNKDMTSYGLTIRSNLPRFSEWYTVRIEFSSSSSSSSNDKKSSNSNTSNNATESPKSFVEQTWSVGQFFDKEGYFDEVGLGQEVDKLLQRFADCKYDTDQSLKAKKD